MQNIIIEQKKDTLGITCNFETESIIIKGTSYPENALLFFEPVFKWLEEYTASSKKNINLELSINYLNTSSSKCILDLLEILDEYYEKTGFGNIIWFYSSGDRSMFETGEEFKDYLSVPFKIVEKKL